MESFLTLHLFQWEVFLGHVEKNIEKVENMFCQTDIGKGDLVILPEMFPSGFSYDNLDEVSKRSDEIVQWMSGMTCRYGVSIGGTLATHVGDGIANTMTLMGCEGENMARYNKIHLFPVTGEDRHFVPGSRVVTALSGGIKYGLAICFDLRFPELSRRLCLEGAQIMLVSAQWPMARISHFNDLVRVRAMENQMFVAACNSCGEDGAGMTLGGGSLVADPSGEVKGTLGREEGVLSIKIDLEEIQKSRKQFPVLECRRGDIFGER